MFYNDFSNISIYLSGTLVIALFYFCAITLHEFGHIIYFVSYFKRFPNVSFDIKNFSITIGKEEDYAGMPLKHYRAMLFTGIVAGFVPIFILGSASLIGFLLGVPYLYGCRSDIGQLGIVWEED